MSSVPSTPKSQKVKRNSARNTPKSTVKRTIHNIDDSYIEDEDDTYINDTTILSDDEEDYEIIEENILEELKEVPEVTEVTNGVASTPEASTPDQILQDVHKNLLIQSTRLRQFIVDHEVPRKVLHSSIGIFTLWLYTLGVHQSQLILPLGTLFVIIFTNDYIRFRNPEFNAKVIKSTWFLIREKEIDQYNGVLSYLIGLIIVFAVLPKDISLMCVLLLSWADTAASTIGRRFGKYTPQITNGKSLAGSLASFFTGVVSAYAVYGYFIPVYNAKVNVPGDVLWSAETNKLSLNVLAIASGVIASTSEAIGIFGLDDNFTIPVISGFFLFGLVTIFQQ